jgi:carbon-monoxide dehydrogenase large subunit
VKGIGEAGTIASSVAVINAICDALAPLGIKHVDMPASPDRLWKQIHDHRSGVVEGVAPTHPTHQAVPATGGTDHSAFAGSLTDEGTDPHQGLAEPEGHHQEEDK